MHKGTLPKDEVDLPRIDDAPRIGKLCAEDEVVESVIVYISGRVGAGSCLAECIGSLDDNAIGAV